MAEQARAMLENRTPLESIEEHVEDPPQHTDEHVEGWEAELPEADQDWKGAFDEMMATDPAFQIAGEEDTNATSKAIKEKIALIPETVKAEVRRAHHALGHCGRATLLRLAKYSKKSEDHLFYIKHFQCPACMQGIESA